MLKINTDFLRGFSLDSQVVKQTALMQESRYWKMGIKNNNLFLIKSNMNVFIQRHIRYEAPDEIIYLDEKKVVGFIMNTTATEITVEVKGGKVLISDGKMKVDFQVFDGARFPQFPTIPTDAKWLNFDEATNKALELAAKHTSTVKNETWLSYVHIGESIFASNGFFVYSKDIKSQQVKGVLSTDLVDIITGKPGHLCYSEKFAFYLSEITLYAFIRTEFNTVDFTVVTGKPADGPEFLEVNMAEMRLFCNLVRSTSDSTDPVGMVTSGRLVHDDAEFGSHVENEIGSTGSLQLAFKFLTNDFLTTICSLPYQRIKLFKMGQHIILLTDEDASYKGIISGLN